MPAALVDDNPIVGQGGDMQMGLDVGVQQPAQFINGADDKVRLGAQMTGDQLIDTLRPAKPPEPQNTDAQAAGTAGGTGRGAAIVQAAKTMLGVKYVYGGTDPKNGVDCSGMVQQAYKMLGIDLPRVTYDQVNVGTEIDPGAMQPGDLIFTTGDIGMRRNGHVGIYVGDGQWIVAPKTGDVVKITAIPKEISAVRRPW